MRYLLFMGDDYYPLGGASDLQLCTETLPTVDTLPDDVDWAHVYDLETRTLVADWQRVPEGTAIGPGGWYTQDEYQRRLRQVLIGEVKGTS